MKLRIVINNVNSFIYGNINPIDYGILNDKLSYTVKDFFFMPSYQSGKWDGRIRLMQSSNIGISFPTGLLDIVYKTLRISDENYEITFVDKRKRYKPSEIIEYTDKINEIELRDYQSNAVDVALKHKRGMLKVATGGGKSLILMKIVKELSLPANIYVNRQDIFFQLHRTFERYLDIEVGLIGAGIINPKKVNICMYQTMVSALGFNKKTSSYQDKDSTVIRRKLAKHIVEKYPVMIIDEAHHASCESIKYLQEQSKNALYRIFTTATPFREDGADIMIFAASGRILCDVSASHLIRNGFLSKPYIYMLKNEVDKKYLDLSYTRQYKYIITENLDRNLKILKVAIKALLNKKRTLIAVKQVKHGRELKKALHKHLPEFEDKIKFVFGGSDSDERKNALDDLNDGKIFVVVATSIFGEGVDIENLEVLINAKAQKSAIDSLQLAGRVLRVPENGKKEVMIVDIADYGKNFTEYTNRRKEIYNREEEYEVIDVDDINEITYPFFT